MVKKYYTSKKLNFLKPLMLSNILNVFVYEICLTTEICRLLSYLIMLYRLLG